MTTRRRTQIAVLLTVFASGIGLGHLLAQHSFTHPFGLGEGNRSSLTGADTHYPPSWKVRLLGLVGAPRTTENMRLLTAWGLAEGGTAKWNALNGTYQLPYGESWSYNSSSVQNYWRPTGGVAANVLILIQSDYAGILGDLQSGKYTAEQIVNRDSAQFQKWGTSPSTMLRVLQTH